MYVDVLLVYIRTYKTAWHKNLMVIKFYGQPKLLREKVDKIINFAELQQLDINNGKS